MKEGLREKDFFESNTKGIYRQIIPFQVIILVLMGMIILIIPLLVMEFLWYNILGD